MTMDGNNISRRRALQYLGMLAATAAGREFLSNWLPAPNQVFAAVQPGDMASMHATHQAAPAAQSGKPYAPQFFNPEEFQTVEIVTELIIPSDDGPGAKEAEIAKYLDFLVFSAAEHLPSLQQEWTEGLKILNRESQKQYGKPFRSASPADREKLFTEMSLPESDPTKQHPGFAFYKLTKEMTVDAFYTSKVGLMDVLGYKGLSYLLEFPGCEHPEHYS
jgi:hypothetical protein